ncbi:hypothetical protein LL912_08210 [Niabella sp. CC-SYL272]|uniref:hypothetical protein n=1 Tax=Niabella agricola TaxID=2891571 RepID=UPI001F18A6DE|nr:hypothetical protein [Niabella agricola]MCF3108759.1 hypothetical protein [Niabella agricola]
MAVGAERNALVSRPGGSAGPHMPDRVAGDKKDAVQNAAVFHGNIRVRSGGFVPPVS